MAPTRFVPQMRQCESAQYNQKVPGPEIGNLLSRDSRWNKKSERCRLESEPRTPHPTCNVEPPAGSVDRRRSDLFIPFAGPLGRANSTLKSGDRGARTAPHALTFYSIYCTRVGVSSLCNWARVAGGMGRVGTFVQLRTLSEVLLVFSVVPCFYDLVRASWIDTHLPGAAHARLRRRRRPTSQSVGALQRST